MLQFGNIVRSLFQNLGLRLKDVSPSETGSLNKLKSSEETFEMKFRNLLAATAAISLAASPAVAQSANADRAAAPVAKESKLGGESGGAGIILALLAAAAIIAGIVIAAGNEDDTAPTSP